MPYGQEGVVILRFFFDNKIWVMGGWSDDYERYYNDVWYSSDGVNWIRATASAGWLERE